MGTGVSGWEGGGVGKPGAVRKGKVVGRELGWSRGGLDSGGASRVAIANEAGWGGQISTDRSGAPRRGTCGAAVCCRCGRASRDSPVAIRPDNQKEIRTKSQAIVLVGRCRAESEVNRKPANAKNEPSYPSPHRCVSGSASCRPQAGGGVVPPRFHFHSPPPPDARNWRWRAKLMAIHAMPLRLRLHARKVARRV